MSFIDRALRIRERTAGAEDSDAATSESRRAATLHQYPREQVSSSAVPIAPAATAVMEDNGHRNDFPVPPKEMRSARLPENPEALARLVTGGSSAIALEQYRKIAAVLHDEQVHRQLKTVMVTSALPQEGKTLTTLNLALTLSESYARRVLMIDADLRWPSLHTLLGAPNDEGLSDVLGNAHHEYPFVRVSDRLTVLTAGHPGVNPLAGLTSQRMERVIEECAAHFDWVVIDTPPVGVLPDAQVLARLVGAVVLVIRAGSTPAAAVGRAIDEIGADSIIGAVLNQVEERRIHDVGHYGQYGYLSRGVQPPTENRP